MEELFGIACGLIGLALLLAIPVVLAIVYARTRNMSELVARLERLERAVYAQTQRSLSDVPPSAPSTSTAAASTAAVAEIVTPPVSPLTVATQPTPKLIEPMLVAERIESAAERLQADSVNWEQFIGRKALGWTAVVVLLFATAFFLRYAFENQWIGPLGRVAIGITAGVVLAWRGWSYERRGWHVFAQMLLAASIVLIYLSTYSAFAFYHLLSQQLAAVFLIALVAESAVVAVRMESPAIALMAVVGGLLTPLLMHSQHDQYASLFMYLAMLNLGVVLLLMVRRWYGVGSVALLGTQALFWAWYFQNYHPEKLAWAAGFQGVLWLLYFVDSFRPGRLGRRANPEELLRVLANAALLFGGIYVLLEDDYRPWLGTIAVALAMVYALAGQFLVSRSRGKRTSDDPPLVLVNLAVASGLIALAFPLQAAAPWVALGWAAEAGLLWWFGLRIRNIPLRAMGGVLALATVLRIFAETPPYYRAPFPLILNDYALPSLAAVACLIFAIAIGRRFFAREAAGERTGMGFVFVGCILLIWWIVSVDLYQYFMVAPVAKQYDPGTQQRLAQMSLSAWWASYAAIVLGIGFRLRLSLLRWTALGLFALTVGKVFVLDMSGLDQIYRIVAFFVLALLLGLAAWAYQRQQPDDAADRTV